MIADEIKQLSGGLRDSIERASKESDLLETPAGRKVSQDALQAVDALEALALELAEAIE